MPTVDDLLAQAHAALDRAQSFQNELNAATPQLDGARGLKAQHPGAYDDLTDEELQAKIDAKNNAAGQGYHPSLDTSPMQAALEGFLSGSAQGAVSPAGKAAIGGAASLLGPAGIPVAAGTEAIADWLASHYDTENAPRSLGDAVTNVGEAAAAPAISSAISTAVPYLAKLPAKITGPTGAIVGGYQGYRRGGIPGAIEGAVLGGGAGAALPQSIRALGTLFGDAPEAATAAESATPDTIPYKWSQADEVPYRGPSGVQGNDGASLGDLMPDILARSADTPAPAEFVDSMGPDVSSGHEAALHNIERNAPYGEGQLFEGPRPSELPAPSLDGLNTPQTGPVQDVGFYGLPTPRGADVELLDGGPESGRFPTPGRGGQDVPNGDDVDSLVSDLVSPRSPASATSGSPLSVRALARGDEYWGPGTLSRSGEPAMADESNRMLYDPQTDSAYLRQQLRAATNPAEREYLAKVLRQRYNVNSRPGATGPSKYAAPPSR